MSIKVSYDLLTDFDIYPDEERENLYNLVISDNRLPKMLLPTADNTASKALEILTKGPRTDPLWRNLKRLIHTVAASGLSAEEASVLPQIFEDAIYPEKRAQEIGSNLVALNTVSRIPQHLQGSPGYLAGRNPFQTLPHDVLGHMGSFLSGDKGPLGLQKGIQRERSSRLPGAAGVGRGGRRSKRRGTKSKRRGTKSKRRGTRK